MNINELCKSAPVTDPFERHPLGKFRGVITKATQCYNNKINKPYYDISVKTSEGEPPSYIIWGFSEQDMAEIAYDQEKKVRAIKHLGRIKFLLSGVLKIPREKLDSCDWETLVRCIGALQGKPCEVIVEEDKNDSKYLRTYINPSSESESQTHSVSPLTKSQESMTPTQAPVTSMSQSTASPPSNVPLDDIPF